MLTEYICKECRYTWSNDSKIKFVRICPNCRSFNIEINDNTFINDSESEERNYSKVDEKRNVKINEYIVPWMIDI